MEQPPSYKEATSLRDAWEVIAPYVDIHDYYNLCLVSKQLYSRFSALLWKDPLRMISISGIDPENGEFYPAALLQRFYRLADLLHSETEWMRKFVFSITRPVRPTRASTLAMVVTLDFRILRTTPRISLDGLGPSTTSSVRELVVKLPNLRCLILDGRTDFDPQFLYHHLTRESSSNPQALKSLKFLSMARGTRGQEVNAIPANFFSNGLMAGLVYLDLSHAGWSKALIENLNTSFRSENLPNLRSVRLKGKGLDFDLAFVVVRRFSSQLRSLDLSSNPLNDRLIPGLLRFGLGPRSRPELKSNSNFEVEGRLEQIRPADFEKYAIVESTSSATFSHPDRYIADSPSYVAHGEDDPELAWTGRHRLIGTEPVRSYSTGEIIQSLAGGPHDPIPEAPGMYQDDPFSRYLTHVYLNDLRFTSLGVHRLLANSSGYVEHFECDRTITPGDAHLMVWLPKVPWLAKSSLLYGFQGGAYLFRPVFASNLRVLKIHHSLISNTPTLECSTTSHRENMWLAENLFRGRADLAFAQTFVPDMNPRLYSLTLSYVPRFSSGAVTERLIEFLKLAAIQEQSIEQMRAAVPRRGPPILSGLRHVRLEFVVNVADGSEDSDNNRDVDQAMAEFSSFSEGAWDAPASSSKSNTDQKRSAPARKNVAAQEITRSHDQEGEPSTYGQRMTAFPYNQTETEYYDHAAYGSRKAKVWIGSGVPSSSTPSINAYMRNVAAEDCRYMISPQVATPSHVAAGVPAGVHIFSSAWDRILVPEDRDTRRPTAGELSAMKDVLQEIKAFRVESREAYRKLVEGGEITGEVGQHVYWKGKLEIVMVPAQAGPVDLGFWG